MPPGIRYEQFYGTLKDPLDFKLWDVGRKKASERERQTDRQTRGGAERGRGGREGSLPRAVRLSVRWHSKGSHVVWMKKVKCCIFIAS